MNSVDVIKVDKADKIDMEKIDKLIKKIEEDKNVFLDSSSFSYFINYLSIKIKGYIKYYLLDNMKKEDFEFKNLNTLNEFFSNNDFKSFSNKGFSSLLIYDIFSFKEIFKDEINFLENDVFKNNLIDRISRKINYEYRPFFMKSSLFKKNREWDYFINEIKESITKDLLNDQQLLISFNFICSMMISINIKSLEIKDNLSSYKKEIYKLKTNICLTKEEVKIKEKIDRVMKNEYLTQIANDKEFNKKLISKIRGCFSFHVSNHLDFWSKIRQKKIYDLIGRKSINHLSYLKKSNIAINEKNKINYIQNIEEKEEDFDLFMKENEKFFYPSYSKIGFTGRDQLKHFKSYLRNDFFNDFEYHKGISKKGWRFLTTQNKNYLLRFVRFLNLGVFCANNQLKDAWLRSNTLMGLINNRNIYYLFENIMEKSIKEYNGPIKYWKPFLHKKVFYFNENSAKLIYEDILLFINEIKDKKMSNWSLKESQVFFMILFGFLNNGEEYKKNIISGLIDKITLLKRVELNIKRNNCFQNKTIEEKENLFFLEKEKIKNKNIAYSIFNSEYYFSVNEYNKKTIINEFSSSKKEIIESMCFYISKQMKEKIKIKNDSPLFNLYQEFSKKIYDLDVKPYETVLSEISDYIKSIINSEIDLDKIKIDKIKVTKQDILNYSHYNKEKNNLIKITEKDIEYKTYKNVEKEYYYDDENGYYFDDKTLINGVENKHFELSNRNFRNFLILNKIKRNEVRRISSFDHLLTLSDRWHKELNKTKKIDEEKSNFTNFNADHYRLIRNDDNSFVFKQLRMEYINNSISLHEEGETMHHCVYSYKEDCEDGNYLVFKVFRRGAFKRATLGLNYYKNFDVGKRYRLSQVYSFSNTSVPEEQRKLCKSFILYLNKQDLLNERKNDDVYLFGNIDKEKII